jgi:hypothetical protein
MSVPDDLHPSHEQLIRRLRTVQNTRAFQNVDILSITDAFTDDQLEKYVADKEREDADLGVLEFCDSAVVVKKKRAQTSKLANPIISTRRYGFAAPLSGPPPLHCKGF